MPLSQLLDNLCVSRLRDNFNRCLFRYGRFVLRNVLLAKLLRISLFKSMFHLQIFFGLDCLKEIFRINHSTPSFNVSVQFQLFFVFLYCENFFVVILLYKISSKIMFPKKIKFFSANFCSLDST